MKSTYYGDHWWGYVARLERQCDNPPKVVKIGITNALDPIMRLTFRRYDEPHPITDYFKDIEVLKKLVFKTKFDAERWERKVMGMTKKKFNSIKFHNWKENDLISGITEMRIWIDEEVNFILSID